MSEENRKKVRYAEVGVGGRATMYYQALSSRYKDTCELVGFCDLSQTRMNYANKVIAEKFGAAPVPTYYYTEFEKMIETEKPDVVIVTSIDRTHDDYIVRAMNMGCDVITEKPITIDEKKAQRIVDTQKKTGRNIKVTFNCRYAPHHTKIRELIMDDTIGEVFSVHFEWLLDTRHGADYYRRWHRNKANSGGLLVHKATHHFDLVNYWLGTEPDTVYALGDLNFYGKQNAEKRGVTNFYYRALGNEAAKGDYFALDLEKDEELKHMYLEAEADSGYIRDRSVFGDDIAIEDTMGLLVRYKNNAIMSYSLNSYMPWEGFNVCINGSKGRIEYHTSNREATISLHEAELKVQRNEVHQIRVWPLFADPYDVDVERVEGGHGGGDTLMMDDLFLPNGKMDRFGRAADHIDGIKSILTGVAANKSIASGLPVKVSTLVDMK